MASIILPRRWQSQPQNPVEIDRNNPLSAGLLVALNLGIKNFSTSGTRLAPRDKQIATGFGATYGVGTSDLITLPQPIKSTDQRTFVLRLDRFGVGGGNFGRILETRTSSAQAELINVANDEQFDYQRITSGTAQSVRFSALNVLNHAPQDIAIVVPAVGVAAPSVYLDRVLVTPVSSNAGSGTPASAFTVTGIGNRASDLARVFDGYLYYFYAFDRLLSQQEIIELHRNPWQIFRPQRRILYFDAGGAGTNTYTYSGDADITFSGTATTTWQKLYSFSGDADITFSGAATTAYVAGAVTYPYNGSGTLTFSGTATTAWLKLYSFNGDADITFSGAATTAYVPAGSTTYSYSGDGSITFSGTATTAWLQLFSYAGSGTLTFSGDATTAYVPGLVEYAYNGSGTIVFSGTAETSGPKIAETVGGGIGHGGFARKSRRLVKVEEAESPEEVIAEIERAFAETTKKPVKKRAQVKVSPKPIETPSVDPGAWLDYFREQSRLVREQQMINDLLAQAKMRVHELQAQETLRRLEALQIQQEEEVLLLLMAA